MITAETILNIARAEIGTKETESNNVKYNTAYYGRTVNKDKYAWCVVFVWWCFREAGNVNMFCYGQKTASTNYVQNTYTSKGTFVTDPKLFRPGDLAVFPGHLAIIERVDLENNKLYTIDGNYSDQVMRVTRTLSTCNIEGACRVPYDIAEELEPEEPEEPDTPEDPEIPNDTPTETPDVVGDGDGLIVVNVYTDGLTGTPEIYNADGQTLLSPFSECYRLDEALDNASITLAFIDRKEPFEPFTFVSLDDTNADNDAEFWCVQNDEVTEYPSIGKYTHKILLIETTKYMERFIVGTKTVTQPLSRSKNDIVKKGVSPTFESFYNNSFPFNFIKEMIPEEYREKFRYDGLSTTAITTPIFIGETLNIPSLSTILNVGENDVNVSDGMQVNIKVKVYTDKEELLDKELDSVLDSESLEIKLDISCPTELFLTYTFKNYANAENPSTGDENTVTYMLYVLPESILKSNVIHISDVCNVLCDVADLHMQNGSSRFTFKDEEELLKNIVSPEFTFTESNLYEALAIVGNYVHGIPRLKVFFSEGCPVMQARFDYLGKNESTFLDGYYSVNGRQISQDMEQYCTALDTIAENLVISEQKIKDTTVNAAGTPSCRIGKTLRAEEGEFRITENTAILATDYPIERIHAVYLKYGDDDERNITNYIYEQAEYAALSSHTNVFPYSKQYALYYTQGEKNIKGLTFEKENVLSQIFEDPAIVAIYKMVSNKPISNWFKPANQMKFKVRIIYTPIISVKIRQRKSDAAENKKNIFLPYNQSANKIDSSAYGRNLAGAICRLGNAQNKKLYITDRITARKTAKKLVGKTTPYGEVITVVTIDFFTEYAKVQLETTKDFNRINQYVGIKSNVRQYEVSEKLACDRHIIYEDFLVVSEQKPNYISAINTFLTGNFYSALGKVFSGLDTNYKHLIDTVLLCGYNTYNDKDKAIKNIVLPTVAYGAGRSMAFSFSFLDNYGAGYGTSNALVGVYNENGSISHTEEYRLQENVPYADEFGKIDTLSILFYTGRWLKAAPALTESANNFPALSLNDRKFASSSRAWSNRVLGTPQGNRLVIHKDNRERLCFTYQIHVVADSGITVSPCAGENLGFITDADTRLYINKLRRPLGKYDTKVPTDKVMIRLPFMPDKNKNPDTNYSSIPHNTHLELVPREGVNFGDQYGLSGKAWAVTDVHGNIVFSKNTDIAPNQPLPTLYIYGAHSLEKL